jgi:ATP-dependent Lhr-like helicase
VVFRDLLAREPGAPAWRDLVRVYRRLEMRGELRGGRMIGGFVGEQFAAPEALDALRAARREAPESEIIRLSACDPLNLIGIITPGPRIPAHLGNEVYFRHGSPLSQEEGRRLWSQQEQARARQELALAPRSALLTARGAGLRRP